MDLSRFPRRRYTPYATPIEPMPRLAAHLFGNDDDKAAVNLYIKRDDMLGLTGGGNKTRKLEFSMAEALQQQGHGGNDENDKVTVITCGAVQSNHCRLTLAACNKEGLPCILVLEERVPGSYRDDASGNHYLFRLLGAARIVVVGPGDAPAKMQEIAAELRARDRRVYVLPGGASHATGALGYAACAAEIAHQVFATGDNGPNGMLPATSFDYIVTASGSGGTHAGLVAGLVALRSRTAVVGISTRHPAAKQRAHIAALAQETLTLATGDDGSLTVPPDAVVVHDDFVGPGYSLPTDAMRQAVTLFARLEGVLLDPVYTGKAAAGLIDLCRRRYFAPGSNVLFLHTGGAPSLYHYRPTPPPSVIVGTGSNGDDDATTDVGKPESGDETKK